LIFIAGAILFYSALKTGTYIKPEAVGFCNKCVENYKYKQRDYEKYADTFPLKYPKYQVRWWQA
jgi:hypothetical protein